MIWVSWKWGQTIAVVDNGILDGDTITPICVPAVGVLSNVLTYAPTSDIDVRVDYVRGVHDHVVVLGRKSHFEVANGTPLEADDGEKDWAEDVDVFGVGVVPLFRSWPLESCPGGIM
jgi:hypothetical protein